MHSASGCQVWTAGTEVYDPVLEDDVNGWLNSFADGGGGAGASSSLPESFGFNNNPMFRSSVGTPSMMPSAPRSVHPPSHVACAAHNTASGMPSVPQPSRAQDPASLRTPPTDETDAGH